MKNLFNTILVHVFYTIGDLTSRLPDWCFYFDFVGNLYQWSMKCSVYFDEKLDHKFWTKPSEDQS